MKEKQIGIFESDSTDDIFIIGDIHGDYQCLVHCLVDLAECCHIGKMDGDHEILEWNENNKTILIFTGDLIHRKRFNSVLDDECSDIYIIETLLRLKKNGAIIIITAGNHEIMNIMDPEIDTYTSPLNKEKNKKYFTDKKFINDFISNTYAWVKVNDILISHGGLCSDYLTYIEERDANLRDDNIIIHVNEKYRSYFKNYDYKKKMNDSEAFNLFVIHDPDPKSHKHNMFWCREWGYHNINCELLEKILKKINSKKMIIAHCPQFLCPEKPQMINFECKDEAGGYKLAKIDLGMSRGFDYNENDSKFNLYLEHNFNRKISILKLKNIKNKLSFDHDCIVSKKLSCIQYLLLKHGHTKQHWDKKNIISNWLGFDIIDELTKTNIFDKCRSDVYDNKNTESMIACLLYPVLCKGIELYSLKKYKKTIISKSSQTSNGEFIKIETTSVSKIVKI